jgi:hypothetical protein
MSLPARAEGFILRRGARTVKNLTPRLGKDTTPQPGQVPGLSANEAVELAVGEKAQKIDLSRLKFPLAAIPDDPSQGGESGHITITVLDSTGNVDQKLLEEWATAREQNSTHPLTQLLLEAVSEEVVRRQS